MNKMDYSGLGHLCIGERHIYSFSREYNMLFLVDKESNRLEKIEILPDVEFFKKNLISQILVWKDKLLLIPCNAKKIYLYSNGEFETVDIMGYVNPDLCNKFSGGFIYEDVVYILGHWCSEILGIDLKSKRVVYDYSVPKKYVYMKNEKKDAFFSAYIFENNKLYIPFMSGGYIVVFDLCSKSIEWKGIGDNEQGFSSILRIDNRRLLIARRNSSGLFVYDEGNTKIDVCSHTLSLHLSMGMYELTNKVLMPVYNKPTYLYDPKSGKVDEMKDLKCVSVTKNGKELYIIKKDGVEIIDTNTFERKNVYFDFSEFDYLLSKKIKDNRISISGITLTCLIHLIYFSEV